MKFKIVAISLLVALMGWVIPYKTVAKVPQPETSPKTQPAINPSVNDNSQPNNKADKKALDVRKTRSSLKPQAKAYNGRVYSKEDVIELIRQYSQQHGISPETPLCIAEKESGFNQFSKNKSSSASGVFQYVSKTWAGTDEARNGSSVFDANANILAAIKHMSVHRSTKAWTVAPSCPPLKFL